MDFLWQLFGGQWRSTHILSQRVRIQDDRDLQVVSTGPCRFVRHPMYVGVILFMICAPIVLGSWWALVTWRIGHNLVCDSNCAGGSNSD